MDIKTKNKDTIIFGGSLTHFILFNSKKSGVSSHKKIVKRPLILFFLISILFLNGLNIWPGDLTVRYSEMETLKKRIDLQDKEIAQQKNLNDLGFLRFKEQLAEVASLSEKIQIYNVLIADLKQQIASKNLEIEKFVNLERQMEEKTKQSKTFLGFIKEVIVLFFQIDSTATQIFFGFLGLILISLSTHGFWVINKKFFPPIQTNETKNQEIPKTDSTSEGQIKTENGQEVYKCHKNVELGDAVYVINDKVFKASSPPVKGEKLPQTMAEAFVVKIMNDLTCIIQRSGVFVYKKHDLKPGEDYILDPKKPGEIITVDDFNRLKPSLSKIGKNLYFQKIGKAESECKFLIKIGTKTGLVLD